MKSQSETYIGSVSSQILDVGKDGLWPLHLNTQMPLRDNPSINEALKLLMATITQQEEKIVTLGSALEQMSCDNRIAQEKLIQWTLKIVQTMQNELHDRIDDSEKQVQNVTYNLQGYADENGSTRLIERRNLKILKPSALLPSLHGIESECNHYLSVKDLQTTSNQRSFIKSSRGHNDSAENFETIAAGVVISDSLDENNFDSECKEKIESPSSKLFHANRNENLMSFSPALRWRWIIRRVINNIRRSNMKIDLSRYRVVKGASIAERLARIEASIYTEPKISKTLSPMLRSVKQSPLERDAPLRFDNSKLDEYMIESKKDTDVILNDHLDLTLKFPAQQMQSQELFESLPRRPDDLRNQNYICSDVGHLASVTGLDDSLAGLLRDQIVIEERICTRMGTDKESMESQRVSIDMQKVISEIDSLHRRMKCIEENNTNMMDCRLSDLELVVQSLQDSSISLNQLIQTCQSNLMNYSTRKTNDYSENNTENNNDISKEFLIPLFQFDNELRNVFQSLRDVENKVTDLENHLASAKREILGASPVVDKESMKSTYCSMDKAQKMLYKCEKLIDATQKIKLSVTTDSKSFSLEFGKIMSQKYDTLLHFKKSDQSLELQKNIKKAEIPFRRGNPLIMIPLESDPPVISDKSDQSSIKALHLSDNISYLNRRKSLSKTFSNQNVPCTVDLITSFDLLKTNGTDEGSQYGISADMDMINNILVRTFGPMKDKLEFLEKGFAVLKATNSKDLLCLESFDRELKRIDSVQKQRDIDQLVRDDELMTKCKDHNTCILYDKKVIDNNEISDSWNHHIIICQRSEIELEIEVNTKEDDSNEHLLDDGQIILNKISKPNLKSPSEFNLRNRNNFANQSIEIGKRVKVLSGPNKFETGVVTCIQNINQPSEGDFITTSCGNKEYHIQLARPLSLSKNIDEDGGIESGPSSPPSQMRRFTNLPYSPSVIARRKDSNVGIGAGIPKDNLIEIVRLKYDVSNMKISIKNILRDKINETQVLDLIENTSATIDQEVLTAIENNLINLTDELEDLKHNQNKQLMNFRKQLDESKNNGKLYNCNVMKGDTNFNSSSSVVAAGQCLGCGRVAALQNTPITAIAHGNDTFRAAGFKMPFAYTSINAFRDVNQRSQGGTDNKIGSLSHPISADLTSASFDIGSSVGLVDESRVLVLGSSDSYVPQYSTVRPKTTSLVFSASQRTYSSDRGATAAAGLGLSPVTSGVLVATKQLSEKQSSSARPLQRLGFNGKKSSRAEMVFASERFEQPQSFSLYHK